MMRTIILSLFVAVGLFLFAPPVQVSAFDPVDNQVCRDGAASSSAACTSTSSSNPIAGPDGILLKITNIIAYLAGAAAVIIIVVAGLYFITANGDASKVASARSAVIYAVIGLVVIIAARALVIFVARRL